MKILYGYFPKWKKKKGKINVKRNIVCCDGDEKKGIFAMQIIPIYI